MFFQSKKIQKQLLLIHLNNRDFKIVLSFDKRNIRK